MSRRSVEASGAARSDQIFKKNLSLADDKGNRFTAVVQAVEYEDPYSLSILMLSSDCYIRMDVAKPDLSYQLQQWIEGDVISNAALIASARLEETMTAFIKYGRPPPPSSLIMWILSRTVVLWSRDGGQMIFGGSSARPVQPDLNTTDVPPYEADHQYIQEEDGYVSNPYQHTVDAATKAETHARPKSAPHTRKSDHNDFSNTFDVTRSLLGKSNALKQLESRKIKARSGAQSVFATDNWTNDHHRLVGDIRKNRHIVEDEMEARRRLLEKSRIRQNQTMDKFRKIRDQIKHKRDAYNWSSDASYEVITLQKIQEDVKYDQKRQHCRADRAVQHIQWTMAPNGFANRRGTSQRGPLLGAGPLPPNATSSLKDPRVDKVMSKYAWDVHGRRHKKKGHSDETSIMDAAMAAIRTAASNASLYKLDLKRVFDDIDVSGDGHITIDEMAQAFDLMGVTLDDLTLDALFRHFDPNGSGSVRFGEFQWAFFNRRSMMKQWRTGTRGLSKRQIETKFRLADTNGNGRLNEREFKKLLLSFGIKLSSSDQDLLVRRFDVDGDGELDLREFQEFIDRDINPAQGGEPADNNATRNSLSSTVPYDDIPAPQRTVENERAMGMSIENLFEKQKEIENRLGRQYYGDDHAR